MTTPVITLIGLDDIKGRPITRDLFARYIPQVAHDDVIWNIVDGAWEDEIVEKTAATPKQARLIVQQTAVSVINFYLDAPQSFPFIHLYGILSFQTKYRSAKVSMVLLRAKLEGKTFNL